MGQKFSARTVVYYFFYGVQWVTGVLVAVLTFAASQDAEKLKDVWLVPSIILWSQNHKLLIFVLSASAVVAKFICDRIGPPWAWQAIQKLLDFLQDQVMTGMDRSHYDEHRVTLFKHTSKWYTLLKWSILKELTDSPGGFRRKDLPSGWFKPIARSGHVSQLNISWFPCFDQNSSYGGVIGEIWRTNGIVRLPFKPGSLPDLDTSVASDSDYKSYAEQARVSVAWLKKRKERRKVIARSFCGTNIEIEGKLWGVVLIDSRKDSVNLTNDEMKFAAAALGKFIERA